MASSSSLFNVPIILVISFLHSFNSFSGIFELLFLDALSFFWGNAEFPGSLGTIFFRGETFDEPWLPASNRSHASNLLAKLATVLGASLIDLLQTVGAVATDFVATLTVVVLEFVVVIAAATTGLRIGL